MARLNPYYLDKSVTVLRQSVDGGGDLVMLPIADARNLLEEIDRLRNKRKHKDIRSPIERFEEKFIPEPTSGCWLWTAGTKRRRDGFLQGIFWFNGQFKGSECAARCSWRIYRGPITDGLHVLHKCDNSLCVNPDHLYLGTHIKNMQDRMERKRTWPDLDFRAFADHWRKVRYNGRGQILASERLSKNDLDAIRSAPKRYGLIKELAKKYALTENYIWRIRADRVSRVGLK